jgi:hypothetical protein
VLLCQGAEHQQFSWFDRQGNCWRRSDRKTTACLSRYPRTRGT